MVRFGSLLALDSFRTSPFIANKLLVANGDLVVSRQAVILRWQLSSGEARSSTSTDGTDRILLESIRIVCWFYPLATVVALDQLKTFE